MLCSPACASVLFAEIHFVPLSFKAAQSQERGKILFDIVEFSSCITYYYYRVMHEPV